MSKEDKMLEELKRIRELLETKPPPSPPKGLWNEFLDFLSKYKVMGLAVAFIMAIYLGALVKALVDDLVMPIVSLVMPGIEWEKNRGWTFSRWALRWVPNYFSHRSFRNLCSSQDLQKMGNRIAQHYIRRT